MYLTSTFIQGGSVFAPVAQYTALSSPVTYSVATLIPRDRLASVAFLETNSLGRRVRRLLDQLLPWPEPSVAGRLVARHLIVLKLFMQLKTNYEDSWSMYVRSATDTAGRTCDFLTLSPTATLWLDDDERLNIGRALQMCKETKDLGAPAHVDYFGASSTASVLARWVAICSHGSTAELQTRQLLAALRYQIIADSLGGLDMEGGFHKFIISKPTSYDREAIWAAARRLIAEYPLVAIDATCPWTPSAIEDPWARAKAVADLHITTEPEEPINVTHTPPLDGSRASLLPQELRRIIANRDRLANLPQQELSALRSSVSSYKEKSLP